MRLRLVPIATAGACLALLLYRAISEAWTNDDALITFRYVQNLVAGEGLVFNPGERIEGISNPLFALLLAPWAALGADMWVVANVLGVAAAAAELLLILHVVRRVTGSELAAAAAGALFASDRVVAVWSTGGLETSLHGALLMSAFAVVVLTADRPARGVPAASVLFALLVASRPEGAAFYLPYLGFLVVRGRSGGEWKRTLTRSLNWFLPGVALLLAVRFLYYGELLANTYAAKVEGVPWDAIGLVYTRAFAERLGWSASLHLVPWIGLAALAWWSWRDRRAQGRPAGIALALAAIYVLYAAALVIRMDGDYNNDFRFFRPIMAILYAGVGCAIGLAWASPDRRARAALAAVLLGLIVSHGYRQVEASPIAPDAPAGPEHKRRVAADRDRWELFREALGSLARPGDTLLVDRAGLRGHGHHYYTVDATGLVSRDLERDFQIRDEYLPDGRRERFPGHARWPRVEFMQRVGFTFIFPRVSNLPPSVPGIDESSPERRKGYPFLHITMPLGGDRYFRAFTSLSREQVTERAIAGRVQVCMHEPFGPLACVGPPPRSIWQ